MTPTLVPAPGYAVPGRGIIQAVHVAGGRTWIRFGHDLNARWFPLEQLEHHE